MNYNELRKRRESNTLTEISEFYSSSDRVGVVMVGRLEGDETIEIRNLFNFEDLGVTDLPQFMSVWCEVTDDDESNHIKEKILDQIIDVEYNFLSDPSNKNILVGMEGDDRFFQWSYLDEDINDLGMKLSTPSAEEIKSYMEENSED